MAAHAVPELIRAAQRRHDYSPRDISARTGGLVSKSTIYGYLKGRVTELPQPDRLVALADALKVPVATLTRAFLDDLGIEIHVTEQTPEQTILSAQWLTPEQQDVLLRQLEMFRRENHE
ncbi:MAG TPA: helix-turn-helix transcriptional regulator [Mycobacteriales bacterium]|jgi:Helix-turn-helix.